MTSFSKLFKIRYICLNSWCWKQWCFIYIFQCHFCFFTEKNPFIYQVTTKGFDAKNFSIFNFSSICIICTAIKAIFLCKIQFKIVYCQCFISCYQLLKYVRVTYFMLAFWFFLWKIPFCIRSQKEKRKHKLLNFFRNIKNSFKSQFFRIWSCLANTKCHMFWTILFITLIAKI